MRSRLFTPHASLALSTAIDDVRSGRTATPLVIMEKANLAENLALFRKHLPNVRLFFATKANSTPPVLEYFVSQGLSFDVASANEIKLLKRLHTPSSALLLSHPVKDDATIRELTTSEIQMCGVDSTDEIDKLAEISLPYPLQILVRIMVDSKGVTVNLNDKFGCRPDEAGTLLQYAASKGFVPKGLAFHVGSQSHTAENYRLGIDNCLKIATELEQQSEIRISTINIGGGFCDREIANEKVTTLEDLLREISVHVGKATSMGYEVIAEPGRALVADAGTLICKVIGVNRRGDIPLVHVDDGIYGALSPQTYESRTYHVAAAPRSEASEAFTSEDVRVHICGRTCDSLDMLKGLHFLPMNIRRGDLLIVPNVGAYGSVNASMFNGFEAPETFLV